MGKPSAEVINDVKKFKKYISKKYNTKKIILFGSQARGETHKFSDVDLLVVSPKFKGKRSLWGARHLYHEWHRHLGFSRPVDFLCYSEDEFERERKRISIVRQATEEGIVI